MLQCKDYFISQLEKGEEFKICFMSHNAYGGLLRRIDGRNSKYNNCLIDTFGGSTDYIVCNKTVRDDYDLIILLSSRKYEAYEVNDLKKIASSISASQEKRVTVGYSFFIKDEDRVDSNVTKKIKIISFKDNNQFEEIVPIIVERFNQIDLLNFVAQAHDELEKGNVIKKLHI